MTDPNSPDSPDPDPSPEADRRILYGQGAETPRKVGGISPKMDPAQTDENPDISDPEDNHR